LVAGVSVISPWKTLGQYEEEKKEQEIHRKRNKKKASRTAKCKA
jgi:hypothetical protein